MKHLKQSHAVQQIIFIFSSLLYVLFTNNGKIKYPIESFSNINMGTGNGKDFYCNYIYFINLKENISFKQKVKCRYTNKCMEALY